MKTAADPVPTAADRLAAILAAQADAFQGHHAALLTADDPEYVHKARVALRRLRSALDGFAPILNDKAASRLNRQARRLFRILGPLRDADVAADKFASAADAAALRAVADAARAKARLELERAHAGDFAAMVADTLASGSLISDDAHRARLARTPFPVLAQYALQKAWTDVQGYGDDPGALSDDDRHEFRKDMKTLRYLAEFLGGAWPGEAQERFLGRMEKLQEALGHLNDIAVHTAGGPLSADLQASFDSALADARSHWRKLRQLGPWWFSA